MHGRSHCNAWQPAIGMAFTLAWVAPAPAVESGFLPEVPVLAPTRLDWAFVAAGFGPDGAKLPAEYDSRKQRYQLYVPPAYQARKPWPLVVFISPGDDPLGWRYWQKPCEDMGMLFCAAYGAGNNCPVGQRIRLVLDMFDDVRRNYYIDPDQTYLAGFSGGGRLACTLAFALPEFCGGVIPVCGTHPLHPLTYLRHRVQDRLATAFVTGANDFNRREIEDYMFPLFQDVGIRSRLWVVPKLGHGIPTGEVLAEVHAWLADDLKRRRSDARLRPGLVVGPNEVPTALQQATRQVTTAQVELKQQQVWRAVALLQGVEERWGKTAASGKAILLQEEIQNDARKAALLAAQRGAEEGRWLSAQARALERFGRRRKAQQAWETLARLQPNTPEGKKAAVEGQRLGEAIAATPKQPYLGLSFAGASVMVSQVVADGPAGKAGVMAGDVLLQIGGSKVATLAEVVRVVRQHKPGDQVVLVVQRQGKPVEVTVEVGGQAAPGDE